MCTESLPPAHTNLCAVAVQEGDGAAVAVQPQAQGSGGVSDGDASDGVWRYDEDGRIVDEGDAPRGGTVESEHLPTWYTEAAQEIAALDAAATGAARPPGSHPWGHLYKLQPQGPRTESPALRPNADRPQLEIIDAAAVRAPDPRSAAQVDIGTETAQPQPTGSMPGQTAASTETREVEYETGDREADDTPGQADVSTNATNVNIDIGDEPTGHDVETDVADQAGVSTDAAGVDVGDTVAADDNLAETTLMQSTAADAPVAVTANSMSAEESYAMWLRSASVPTATSETIPCVDTVVQDPLRTETVQEPVDAELVRTSRVATVSAACDGLTCAHVCLDSQQNIRRCTATNG